jgi:phosphoglycerol transferase MdoB-like AlkP superfamily enzyme
MTQGQTGIEQLQREREHLERLFSDRINFYLVFAAGAFIFIPDKGVSSTYARPIMICTCLISFLMFFALWRTFRLVNRVLDQITINYPKEVYSQSAKAVRFPGNANTFLFFVPLVLLLYFAYTLLRSFC